MYVFDYYIISWLTCMIVVVKGSTVPILIFANKMDISGALTAAECSEALDLQLIKDRPWQIWYDSNNLFSSV